MNDNFNILGAAINVVAEKYQMPVIFSTHPRTRKRIVEKSIRFHPLVRNVEPLGFFDYVFLQQNAYVVLSDSGTISEESAMMKFPAVSIRTSTERPEAVDAGTIVLGGITESEILEAIEIVKTTEARAFGKLPAEYLIEDTSIRVIRVIRSYTSIVNKTIWNK